MNRRDLLKAAIAAPVLAAVPWYVETPTLPRWYGIDASTRPGVAYKVWVEQRFIDGRWVQVIVVNDEPIVAEDFYVDVYQA